MVKPDINTASLDEIVDPETGVISWELGSAPGRGTWSPDGKLKYVEVPATSLIQSSEVVVPKKGKGKKKGVAEPAAIPVVEGNFQLSWPQFYRRTPVVRRDMKIDDIEMAVASIAIASGIIPAKEMESQLAKRSELEPRLARLIRALATHTKVGIEDFWVLMSCAASLHDIMNPIPEAPGVPADVAARIEFLREEIRVAEEAAAAEAERVRLEEEAAAAVVAAAAAEAEAAALAFEEATKAEAARMEAELAAAEADGATAVVEPGSEVASENVESGNNDTLPDSSDADEDENSEIS